VGELDHHATGRARAGRWLADPDVRFGQLIFAGTLGLLVLVGFVFPAPPAVLFLGVVLGALSSLTAMGLVLVYRANRIVNFAQGDLGALAGMIGIVLVISEGWSFWPGLIVAVGCAVILGGLVEIGLVRRFEKAPRLILTVATIGIALLAQAGQLIVPKLFGFTTPPQNFPRPFELDVVWEPIVFQGTHFLVLLDVAITAAILSVFFRRTRFGKAVRASAESADRARLLGIPVGRVNTVVWVLATVLSATAAMVRAPMLGVPIGSVLGPALLLRALAAAVIGRMESLPVTFVAAIGLGIVEQAVLWDTGSTAAVDGVLFFVILAALVFRRRAEADRAEDRAASTWVAIGEVRPVPPELARLPEVRAGRVALAVLAVALLVGAPPLLGAGTIYLLTGGLLLAMVGVSLLLLTGWTGQISLGQMAFLGFGGGLAGSMALHGWNFFVTLGVAGLLGVGVAVLIGLPALRIRGPFLAVTTFAFALAASSYFLNQTYFPVLDPQGRITRPVVFGRFDLDTEHAYYYVVLLVFGLVLASVRSLRRSRTGRALIAARENERAAQAYGINLTRIRLVGFALSGFVAALAGALLMYHQHGLLASPYSAENNIRVFSMAVLGGLGSVPGVIAGAVWFQSLDYFVKLPQTRLITSAAGLLAVLLVLPGGLSQLLYGGRDRLLRLVARRRGVAVPSLLADARVVIDEPLAGGASVLHEVDDAILRVRGLDVAYGHTQVLFGVDLDVARGELLALLGTNGAGKSTLLHAISGLVPASGGNVRFDDDDLTGVAAHRIAERGIVLAPGGKGAFPTLTVAENLDLAGWLYQHDPAHIQAATERVLELFPVLRTRWRERAGNLSGGEQQMLTLGQAFIAKPKLLMIDELSLGLAPVVVEQLLEIVKAIHESGTTVVVVEQSVNVAITLADRAVFLEKGEIRFDGPTADLLDRPDVLRAVFLHGASAVTGNGRKVTGASRARAAKPVERAPFIAVCESCGREHEVALELRELGVSFGGIRAVDGVDLTVRAGQVVGLIGHNGAGKTTILDLISGYLHPTEGRVWLGGVDVTDTTPDVRAMAGLGRSFQDARLWPAMTVHDALATALERHVRTRDPLAAALVSPATRASEREVRERVAELVELLHLEAYVNKFVSELSTGTRRVVDLACALAHGPSVLLLDEPASGIAQRDTEALGPMLLDIRDRTGAALLVVEHDMPLITSVADELMALELGAVIARGAPADVVADPAVIASYLGTGEDAIRRSGARRPRRATAGRR
jgi:ABC-type branched-subunit amino acid transport system ATPase component/branched-subunit amino acid ABC-type transport system permease component